MTRKLPKATVQTFEDIQRESDAPQEPPKKRRRATAAVAPRGPRVTPDRTTEHDPTAEPDPTPPPDPAPEPDPVPERDPQPAYDLKVEYRRSRAREIVGRYTTYSAVGGLLPLPFIDTASVMACIVKMVQSLAQLYHVPFQRDRTRAAVAAIIGGLGQAGAGAVTMAALFKVVPGPGLYSSAMASIASAALTRALGNAFILHFETGGTALEFDPKTLRKYFDSSREKARA